MIVDGITKNDKIIVVIAADDTYKAENCIGGVGKETKLWHTSFLKNDKKYCFNFKRKNKSPCILRFYYWEL